MKLKEIVLIVALLGFISNSYATRYYVNASATGNENGLTWLNAFNDLQSALSVVVFGDEIWVASGQYKPTASTNRTISFVLKNGVNIYGGFAGTEVVLSERDIANNPTTLNGDIGQVGEVSDNSYNIIRGNNITSDIELDGFRIINGNCSSSNQEGGAILFTNSLNGHLLIKDCYFFSNSARHYGGAISIQSSKMTIENCEFRNNRTSGGEGGAIYTSNNSGQSTLIIKDTKFIGNTSRVGACIANTATYNLFIVDRCIFTNNVSENSILQLDDFKTAKILNSYFIGNSVDDFSAEVISVGLVSGSSGTEDFEMVNCTIAHNYNLTTHTIYGEIIYLEKSRYKVRNCIVYGNTTYAGRQINQGRAVSNCLIEGGYTGGTNIINAAPQFVNPNLSATSNFDASLFDYSLAAASPCINAGNNSFVHLSHNFDLNNDARVQGCVVDLGCYESDMSHVFTDTYTVTACDSFTWINGITYTESNNTATVVLQSTQGCDSIVALNLTVNHSATGTDVVSTCGSYTWIDGITYTDNNNTATFTLPNGAGCDSVVTLNLTIDPVNQPSTGTDIVTACDSFTWINGITYTASNNTAQYILPNAVGCDSVITLNLILNRSTAKTDFVIACDSFTWINGVTYTANNHTAKYTLQNSQQCDSVVSLSLIILSQVLDNSVTINGNALTAQSGNVTYQWINCEDNALIPGAIGQSFIPTENGSYAVILTSTMCENKTAVSGCYLIDFIGLTEIAQQNISIFPNPTQSILFIESNFILNKIDLMDLNGKIIDSRESNSNAISFDLNKLSKGVYFIEVSDSNSAKGIYKVVKN